MNHFSDTGILIVIAVAAGMVLCAWGISLLRRPREGPGHSETFDYDHWPKGLYRVLCYIGAICFITSGVSFACCLTGFVLDLFKSLPYSASVASLSDSAISRLSVCMAIWCEITSAGILCDGLTNGKVTWIQGVPAASGPAARHLILFQGIVFLVVFPAIILLVPVLLR